MKILLIALFAITSTFAAEVELNKFRLTGVKRNMTLYELGKNVEGIGAYVQSRITVQGGDPKEETIVIIKDAYAPDANGRYDVTLGYETYGVFMASGSLKNKRVKSARAIEVYYSGLKREMFKQIFEFLEMNQNILTGELRFVTEPYTNTSPYYLTGTIQYILK